jgi:hypothetical protein
VAARIFFFEKKKQKTFSPGFAASRIGGPQGGEALKPGATASRRADPTNKVFLLLFVHKKKILPATCRPFPHQGTPP